jgi:hypothetical protein
MNSFSLQPAQQQSRIFGLEISNNARDVSVGGRRKTQDHQLGTHLEKVPLKQERESLMAEKPSEHTV